MEAAGQNDSIRTHCYTLRAQGGGGGHGTTPQDPGSAPRQAYRDAMRLAVLGLTADAERFTLLKKKDTGSVPEKYPQRAQRLGKNHVFKRFIGDFEGNSTSLEGRLDF